MERYFSSSSGSIDPLAVFEESRDGAVKLPRRGTAGGSEVMPVDIDLERGCLSRGMNC